MQNYVPVIQRRIICQILALLESSIRLFSWPLTIYPIESFVTSSTTWTQSHSGEQRGADK